MNDTRNQHHISQVEQRLNSCNPGADTSRQRIYQLRVKDRERHEIQLPAPKGIKISNNLSMLDLFSLDVSVDKILRHNFENVFQEYETRLGQITNTILSAHQEKRGGIEVELFDLLVLKLMNFVRNPFCVVKMINTFGKLAHFHPTDPKIYQLYEKVLSGNRPHQEYVCKELDITNDQYETWLRMLFMLLMTRVDGRHNFLEKTVEDLLDNPEIITIVHVYKYDMHRCLLSDRGYSEYVDQNQCLSFDFNLRQDAFIRFFFIERKSEVGSPFKVSKSPTVSVNRLKFGSLSIKAV